MRILLVLLLTLSCGKEKIQEISDHEAINNPIFDEYVIKFEHDIETTKGDIPIYFHPLKSNTAGLCVTYSNNKKEVQIDLDFWNKSNEITKEILIFHELGHCVLNRSHQYGSIDECPRSIMNPQLLTDLCYIENREYYINQLKSGE